MQTFPFKTNVFAPQDNPPRTASLYGDRYVDVVIVGGGIVGLSCAYTLREAGLDVAVVEREHVGFASSGRHFGLLMPHFWEFEGDQAETLVAWSQSCLDEIEALVAREDIDCDFRRAEFHMPILHPDDGGGKVPDFVDWYVQAGISARFDMSDQVSCVPFKTYGAMVLENQVTIDAYRLMRGMRKAVLGQGVHLYEGSQVESIEGGEEAVVKTAEGSLRARKVILALNGYSGQFSFLQQYVSPMHTHAIATEALDDVTIESLGCASENVAVDFFPEEGRPQYYQRLRRDRCFYFGGGVPMPAPAPHQLAPDRENEKFRKIHAEMIRRHPALKGVPIRAAWGGPIAMTDTNLPIISHLPEKENVIVAITGNGQGMGLGTNAGRLVVGLVLGKDKLDAPTRAFLGACERFPR